MTISAHKGIINVDPNSFDHRLVASTCPTTFPLDGSYVSWPFRFMPRNDSKNDLVLVERLCGGVSRFTLYHIKREEKDGKVVVKENPDDVRDMVGAEINYQVLKSGIELRVRKTRFTSDANTTTAEGESVMVVDAESILKFIAGYISLRKLRSAGRRLQARLTLQEGLARTKAELGNAQHELLQAQLGLAEARAVAVIKATNLEGLRKDIFAFGMEMNSGWPFCSKTTVSRIILEILNRKYV